MIAVTAQIMPSRGEQPLCRDQNLLWCDSESRYAPAGRIAGRFTEC